MSQFAKIKDIRVEASDSWKDKYFLTFDLDWCEDFVLEYLLERLVELKVAATFFVTHKTPLLDDIRRNKHFELGIHPNFNRLLTGDVSLGENTQEVLSRSFDMVPDAVSVRSHSLVESSVILNEFAERGLQYDLNCYVPWRSGVELKPWRFWNPGITRVPHFWEDDIHCCYEDPWDVNIVLRSKGLKVFDFHPIHIYLNTEHTNRYEASRHIHRDFKRIQQHRNTGNTGAERFLSELCSYDAL